MTLYVELLYNKGAVVDSYPMQLTLMRTFQPIKYEKSIVRIVRRELKFPGVVYHVDAIKFLL